MPANYYVTTTDGRVHHLSDVTALSIVENDGTATYIYDGVYRDVLNFPNTGDASATLWKYGPGWSANVTISGSPLAQTAYNVSEDDIWTHTPPRDLKINISHWKFETSQGDYFIPVNNVVAMSNHLPTF